MTPAKSDLLEKGIRIASITTAPAARFSAGDPSYKETGSESTAAMVSVIMVVYHTGPSLENSLNRILQDPLVAQLILVDNGSSDAEKALMSQAAIKDQRVLILRGHGNIGFARGVNLGAGKAVGRVLCCLNPDAALQPGALHSLITTLDMALEAMGDKDLKPYGPASGPCLVGANILSENLQGQRGARRGDVTLLKTFLSLFSLVRLKALRRFDIHLENQPMPDHPVLMPTISGAGFVMTRQDFLHLGGFDEGYFLHVEDIDLCWRVRQAGGAVLFDPGARIVHLGGTSKSGKLIIGFWKGRGFIRYFLKRAKTPLAFCGTCFLAPLILGLSLVRPLVRLLRQNLQS